MHAHVVPAEAPQDLRPQPEGLAQRVRDRLGVALDHDRLAVVLGDEGQQAPVVDVDGHTEPPQLAGEGPRERVGEILQARVALPCGQSAEDAHERRRAVLESTVIEGRRADGRHDDHRPPRARHADGQQPIAVGRGEVAEVAQHAPVAGEAEAEREDHPVPALGDGLLQAQHRERLRRVARDEVGHVGAAGEGRFHSGTDARRMPGAGRDDHEGLLAAVDRVLHHERDHARDLGIRTLHGTGHGIGHARAALDVVDAEAPASEIRPGPRQRGELAAVERVVDEFGEVLSPGAVAAGEGRDGHEFGKALEHADAVERLRVFGFEAVVLRQLAGRDAERRGLLRDGVSEHDDLARPAEGRGGLGEGERGGIRDDDHVEVLVARDARHVVGRGEPDGSEGAHEGGGGLQHVGGADAVLQGALEGVGLVGVIDQADPPLGRELRREERTGSGRVGLVDEPEVSFQPVHHRGVRAQKSAIRSQHVLERRLPPREFQLRFDVLFGNVPHRQLRQQRLEAHLAEFGAEGGAFDEVVEVRRLGGERRQGADEGRDGKRRQRVRAGAAQHTVEVGELRVGPLPRGDDVGEAERHLRRDPGVDEALPLGALVLDAQQRLVHVGHVHARTDVLLRQAPQPTAIRPAHRGCVPARRVRLDELDEGPLEHRGAEPVERVADALQHGEVLPEVGDRAEGVHAGLGDQLVSALQKSGHVGAVQAPREGVGGARILRRRERDAVPRRVVGPEAELTEPRGGGQLRGGHIARGRQTQQGAHPEARRGRRRHIPRGQARQRAQDVEHRHLQGVVGLRHGGAVVAQHAAQAHERVVDVGDLRRLCLLVAPDRADQVAAQRSRRDREAGQPDAGEAVPDAVEGRPSRAHHQHALAVAHERADGVDHGLRAPRAGQGVHREGLSGEDAREDRLLLGVRVEQERVGGGRSLVGVRHLRHLAASGEGLAVGEMPGERIQHGVVEVAAVARHGLADVGEARDHQPGVHPEVIEAGGERAQVVDDGLGLEHPLVVG